MISNQIKIKANDSEINVQKIAGLLCQSVLMLRDRNNTSQSIELLGTGNAIQEKKFQISFKQMSFIVQSEKIDYYSRKKNSDGVKSGIKIKLTYQPSNYDCNQPGFQYNENVQNDWNNLYDFVMMYSKDLAAYSIQQQRSQTNKPPHKMEPIYSMKSQEIPVQVSNRGQLRTRGQQRTRGN